MEWNGMLQETHPPRMIMHKHKVLIAKKLLFTCASFYFQSRSYMLFYNNNNKKKVLFQEKMQRTITLSIHGGNAINVTTIMSKDCRPHKNKTILPSMTYKTRCNSQVSTEERYSRTDTTVENWCKFCTS